MTKERFQEICDLLLVRITHLQEKVDTFGLCMELGNIVSIEDSEAREFLLIMNIYKPTHRAYSVFWWPILDTQSRIDFINKLKELPEWKV